MSIKQKLLELGLVLPEVKKPVANYINAKKACSNIYISGQLPFKNNQLIKGKVTSSADVATAQEAAKLCALNVLANLEQECGDLDNVEACIRLAIFVNCDPDFTDISLVANGASDLIVAVFGENGRSARSAIGAASLPLGALVEVEGLFRMKKNNNSSAIQVEIR